MQKLLFLHIALFLFSISITFFVFDSIYKFNYIFLLFNCLLLSLIFALSFILQYKHKSINELKLKCTELEKHEHLIISYEAMLGFNWDNYFKNNFSKKNTNNLINLLKDFISLHERETYKKLPLFEIIWKLKHLYEVEFFEDDIKLKIENESKKLVHVKVNGLIFAIYLLINHKKVKSSIIKMILNEDEENVYLYIFSKAPLLTNKDKGYNLISSIIKDENKGNFTTSKDGYKISFKTL